MITRNSLKQPSFPEFIEIVDSCNQPLGVLSRKEAHQQGLYHRSVLVLIYDDQNRLLIQKRHGSKRIYPGRWDLPATGHVPAGESAVDAACAKLRKQLGVEVPPWRIRHLTTINATAETNFEFIYLFSGGKIHTSPVPVSGEVEEITFLNQNDMEALVLEFPDILTPELVYFWRRRLLFAKF
ncbi:MAG: NUDIX domain-containing protein [Desulfonatronovibrio sp.]